MIDTIQIFFSVADIGLTVKVFLGFEYECIVGGGGSDGAVSGHRFMAASPDRPMARQAQSGGGHPGTAALRDATSKVLNHDMPLYMTCPCRWVEGKVLYGSM